MSAATHALCNSETSIRNSDHMHTMFDQRLLSILHQEKDFSFANSAAKPSVDMC